MEEKELAKKTWKELRRVAKDLHISGWQRMKRKHLTEAILQKEPVAARDVEVLKGMPEVPELPEAYGKTRLALLEVDPFCVHAYWEITEKDLVLARKKLGQAAEEAKQVLRIYDVTGVDFDGANANYQWDIEFEAGIRNRYINLSSPKRALVAEIGLRGANGEFVPLARSNLVQTPPAKGPSIYEEKWLLVKGDFEEVRAVTGQTQPAGRMVESPAAFTEPETLRADATSPGLSEEPSEQ